MAEILGKIVIELYEEKAPCTIDNFKGYCHNLFYNNTIFHKVINGTKVQGGRYISGMVPKNVKLPVHNEADNGLKNLRGTVAMARDKDPHSATSQFFINTKDNEDFDYLDKTIYGWGYCVFGKVIEGMDIVDRIENTETTFHGIHHSDVPVKNYYISHVKLMRNIVTFTIAVE